MYSVEDGEIHGVLLDFDLAVFLDKDGREPASQSEFRTGTPAFMAIDLMEEPKGPHIYRYDLESLLWVIIWYAANHDDGERLQNEALPGWYSSASDRDIARSKREILKTSKIAINKLYAPLWRKWIVSFRFILIHGYSEKAWIVDSFYSDMAYSKLLKETEFVEVEGCIVGEEIKELENRVFTQEEEAEVLKSYETLCGRMTFENLTKIIERLVVPDGELIIDPISLI